ncbi:MAG: pilus assembly protein PilM, partial [Candidatus Andersenbacteria bacterium]
AAPKDVVTRYTKLIDLLKLNLFALEVETFPLVRSLLAGPQDTAMIVDIGDLVTTFHIIDQGTPRVSHSIDYGGGSVTQAIAQALAIDTAAAEEKKVSVGLKGQAAQELVQVTQAATEKLWQQAKQLLELYGRKMGRRVPKTILIGGGANMRGLPEAWAASVGHPVVVGNPWRGLSFPQTLEPRLQELGPFYAVAVGLAQRGFIPV